MAKRFKTIGLILSLILFLSTRAFPSFAAEKPTVAVLRFENKSEVEELDYLEDFFPNVIIYSLLATEQLTLVKRNEIQALIEEHRLGEPGISEEIAQSIGKFLGARYLIQGDFKGELTGRESWRISLTCSIHDLVKERELSRIQIKKEGIKEPAVLVAELVKELIDSFQLTLSRKQEQAISREQIKHAEYLGYYLRGRFWGERRAADKEKARDFFKKALLLSPNDPEIYYHLAKSTQGQEAIDNCRSALKYAYTMEQEVKYLDYLNFLLYGNDSRRRVLAERQLIEKYSRYLDVFCRLSTLARREYGLDSSSFYPRDGLEAEREDYFQTIIWASDRLAREFPYVEPGNMIDDYLGMKLVCLLKLGADQEVQQTMKTLAGEAESCESLLHKARMFKKIAGIYEMYLRQEDKAGLFYEKSLRTAKKVDDLYLISSSGMRTASYMMKQKRWAEASEVYEFLIAKGVAEKVGDMKVRNFIKEGEKKVGRKKQRKDDYSLPANIKVLTESRRVGRNFPPDDADYWHIKEDGRYIWTAGCRYTLGTGKTTDLVHSWRVFPGIDNHWLVSKKGIGRIDPDTLEVNMLDKKMALPVHLTEDEKYLWVGTGREWKRTGSRRKIDPGYGTISRYEKNKNIWKTWRVSSPVSRLEAGEKKIWFLKSWGVKQPTFGLWSLGKASERMGICEPISWQGELYSNRSRNFLVSGISISDFCLDGPYIWVAGGGDLLRYDRVGQRIFTFSPPEEMGITVEAFGTGAGTYPIQIVAVSSTRNYIWVIEARTKNIWQFNKQLHTWRKLPEHVGWAELRGFPRRYVVGLASHPRGIYYIKYEISEERGKQVEKQLIYVEVGDEVKPISLERNISPGGVSSGLRALIEQMGSKNWTASKEAYQVLVKDGEEFLPEILSYLDKCSSRQSVLLIYALGDIHSEAAVPHLVKLLGETQDANIRLAAIDSLGRIGGKEVIPSLKKILMESNDQATEAAVIRALGRSGASGAANVIWEKLLRKNSECEERFLVGDVSFRALANLAAKGYTRELYELWTGERKKGRKQWSGGISSLKSIIKCFATEDICALVPNLRETIKEEIQKESKNSYDILTKKGYFCPMRLSSSGLRLSYLKSSFQYFGLLFKKGSLEARRKLEFFLKYPHPYLQLCVAEALAQGGDYQGFELVKNFAENFFSQYITRAPICLEYGGLQGQALSALSSFPKEQTVPVLIPFLNHRRYYLQQMAVYSLQKATGLKLDTVQQWEEWRDKQNEK